MADNVQISQGSGTTIRTIDNGSGNQKQLVALDIGGENAESIVTATNPLPVTLNTSTTGTLVAGQSPTLVTDPIMTDNMSNLLVSSVTPLQVHDDLHGTHAADNVGILRHEGEREQAFLEETATLDTNLANVFGSQSLLDPLTRRLLVSDQPSTEITVTGAMSAVNREVRMTLTGQGTVTVTLYGTWAGTITFSCSVDGQNWSTIYGEFTGGQTLSTSTTSNNTQRFKTAGLLYFRAQFTTYTSGTAFVELVATPLNLAPSTVSIMGNAGQTLQQKATSFEMITYDSSTAPSTGLLQNAFTNADPWNPKGVYFIGDVVTYNGQVYQCIQATGANFTVPTTVANWQVDQRQNKSLVTTVPMAPPSAARLRVEIDLDGYQYRLAESELIYTQLSAQNALLQDNYLLYILSAGNSGGQGYAAYPSDSSSSHYIMEEIR